MLHGFLALYYMYRDLTSTLVANGGEAVEVMLPPDSLLAKQVFSICGLKELAAERLIRAMASARPVGVALIEGWYEL